MSTHSVIVLRWVARVWSLLSVITVLAFAIGESVGSSGPRPTPQEWVGLALFPIGVVVGLVVAWYREAWGGALALGCLIGFYLWNFFRSGHLPRGPYFILFAAPGLIFLIVGSLSRRSADWRS